MHSFLRPLSAFVCLSILPSSFPCHSPLLLTTHSLLTPLTSSLLSFLPFLQLFPSSPHSLVPVSPLTVSSSLIFLSFYLLDLFSHITYPSHLPSPHFSFLTYTPLYLLTYSFPNLSLPFLSLFPSLPAPTPSPPSPHFPNILK